MEHQYQLQMRKNNSYLLLIVGVLFFINENAFGQLNLASFLNGDCNYSDSMVRSGSEEFRYLNSNGDNLNFYSNVSIDEDEFKVRCFVDSIGHKFYIIEESNEWVSLITPKSLSTGFGNTKDKVFFIRILNLEKPENILEIYCYNNSIEKATQIEKSEEGVFINSLYPNDPSLYSNILTNFSAIKIIEFSKTLQRKSKKKIPRIEHFADSILKSKLVKK